MKTPEFEGKIAPVEIKELETKLVDLDAMIEKKLERINEIEEILDKQEFFLSDSEKKLSEEVIDELIAEKDKLIEEKEPLETLYDAMLAQKEKVLTRKTLLN